MVLVLLLPAVAAAAAGGGGVVAGDVVGGAGVAGVGVAVVVVAEAELTNPVAPPRQHGAVFAAGEVVVVSCHELFHVGEAGDERWGVAVGGVAEAELPSAVVAPRRHGAVCVPSEALEALPGKGWPSTKVPLNRSPANLNAGQVTLVGRASSHRSPKEFATACSYVKSCT